MYVLEKIAYVAGLPRPRTATMRPEPDRDTPLFGRRP